METKSEELALVKPEHLNLSVLVAGSQDRLKAIGEIGAWIAGSGMYNCDRPEQGNIILIRCIEEGITLSEYERTYDLVFNKSRKKALAALAEFESKGGEFEWIEDGTDGRSAAIKITYKKRTMVSRFTIDDAERAQLVKADSSWQKSAPNMLRARAITNGLGMIAPSIFAGEFESVEAPRPELDITPKAEKSDVDKIAEAFKAKEEKPTAKAPVTIDATVVTVEPSKPAETTKEPDPVPASNAAPLPENVQAELIKAMGGVENLPAATAYCISIDFLKPGEGMDLLSIGNANRIIARPERFQAKIKEHAAK